MAETNKIPYSLILTVIITLTGWGVTFGICQNKISNNEHAITKLEEQHKEDFNKLDTRQVSTDTLLQNINTQLVELNTKMTLLLNGKLTPEGK